MAQTRSDKITDNVRELPNETRRMLDEASERVTELYETSKEFVNDNQTAVMIGAGFLIGVAGFFLGRSSRD
jgi:hypothetical protein